MEFEKRKASTMAAISSTSPDKSPKGNIDAPIIPLLSAINNHPSYFTTSSCSGRISIFSHKPNSSKGGTWAFISHEPAEPNSVLDLIFSPTQSQTESIQPEWGELVFRFEPLIIAIECRDVGSAQFMVSLAISCGFRESGITSVSGKRVIIAIRCSIRMEVPLGRKGRIMVSKDYLRYLVEIANQKMSANWKRTQGFMEGLRKNGFSEPNDPVIEVENGLVVSRLENGGGEADLFEEVNHELVHLNVENAFTAASMAKARGRPAKVRVNTAVVEKERVISDENAEDLGVSSPNSRNSSTVNDLISSAMKTVGKASFNSAASKPVGLLENSRFSLAAVPLEIVGEPAEKLFLWGHSSCPISNSKKNEVLIYGGFGGIGRHARRNDCLLFDPSSCGLTAMPVKGSPSPRLGHTSSVVGDSMIVIGGRADPANILSEVWVFDFVKTEWKLVSDSSNAFSPRHRHAAASVGSKIYLFGGLNESMLYSSLLSLDVATMLWTDVHASGERPSARHSHSLVAHGQKLYLFGGYDGEKALGDLYSFDTEECQWVLVKTLGRSPHPRFSHSMFIYKEYLGIIGGCPVRQHSQELSLLDLNTFSWKHVVLDSVGKELFVRSTANVIEDDLVMIGGGASCYAFGTKFSEPTKINMLPLLNLGNSREYQYSKLQVDTDLNLDKKEIRRDVADAIENAYWVLKLNKKYAKPGKDVLKKFGWLDPGRKVNSNGDGSCIYFPVTTKFCALFSDEQIQTASMIEGFGGLNLCKTSIDSCSKALDLLVAFGATKYIDEFVSMKKTVLSPLQAMKETVALLLKKRGLSEEILNQLPTRWERLGDITVLPITSFRDPAWDTLGMELWNAVAKTLGARRLARQGRVASSGTRDSRLEILVGDSGWVQHRENGIIYSFDATKCMFSWGNLSEKLRMAHVDCSGEVIVDLFAGIGYFTLPFLVRGHAKLVYACEWNPHAVEALRHNLEANLVSDLCIVLEGDNRLTAPKGVANRVCLGLLPSSEGSWVTAVRALRSEGGTLHIHMNVKDSEETEWTQHVVKSISEIAESEGRFWKVSMVHLERVKWYAPHIRHVVADISCENTRDGADQVI